MGSRIYDGWVKLVGAVVRREKLHELAMCDSMESSTLSECSSFGSRSGSSKLLQETNFRGANYHMYEWSIAPAPPSPQFPNFFLMAGSRNLAIESGISTKAYSDYYYDGRNSEVVKLEAASWFVVRGRMKTFMMSRRTIYGAYLVFTLGNGLKGRPRSAKSTIRFVSKESDIDAEEREEVVNFKSMGDFTGIDAVENEDGLLEVQIGDFYIDQGSYIEDVEVSLHVDDSDLRNEVLIVAGMEFRRIQYVKEV